MESLIRSIRRSWDRFLSSPRSQKIASYIFNGETYEDLDPGRAVRRMLSIVSGMIAVFVAIGFLLGISPDWSFREGNPMTLTSVFLLLTIGHLSLQIAEETRSDPNSYSLWRVLGFSFVFFGLDDWLRIHEETDHYIHKIFGIKETELTDHLDDLILVLYGVFVLSVLWRKRQVLKKYVSALRFFAAAVFFAVLHSTIDLFGASKSILRQIASTEEGVHQLITICELVEESSKVFADVFLVGTVIACFRIARGFTRNERAPVAQGGA